MFYTGFSQMFYDINTIRINSFSEHPKVGQLVLELQEQRLRMDGPGGLNG